MATEYGLITQGGTGGSYWASLTTEQKAKYYSTRASQYIVFTGLSGITSYPSTGGISDVEAIVEIHEAFDDTASATSSPMPALYSLTITTLVDGIRTDAFHGGVPGGGYRRIVNSSSYSALPSPKARTVIDGIELINLNTTGGQAINLPNAAAVCIVKNNIVTGYRGITDAGAGSLFLNNIAINCTQYGFGVGYAYGAGSLWSNNLATKCGTGFSNASGSTCYATFINNAAVGNTTANWSTIPSSALASNNAGVSGDTPWNTFGSAVTTLTDDNTTFVDFTNNNFRPAGDSTAHTSSSALTDAAIAWTGSPSTDIVGNIRPSYKNGSATANDIGPFEFDWGYGETPNLKNFTITGLVSGSRVKIKKTSDGTSIYNAVVNDTSLTISYQAGVANTPITIDIRKGSAAPYYKPYRTTSSISYLADTEISVSQIEAIAADIYDSQIATDWSINTGTKTITRNSGGQYSLQALYSWLLDYYDDESTVDLDMPIEGITPAQFELINSGSISDADMQYLNAGSLWDGTTLWANITTVGTQASGTTLHIYVDDVEYTPYWSTGNIDVSLKMPLFDGTEQVDVRAREYTDLYDHWHFDSLSEGKNFAAISTTDDPNNQTDNNTVAAYGITIAVDNPTNQQIDANDSPADYTITVDANGLGVQEVYEFCKYSTQYPSVYEAANASYDEVKVSPYGTFAGGVFFGARGIWLTNVTAGDALNYVLTDNDGVEHSASAPPVQISITNIASSTVTMLQLYDLTNDTQLYVGAVTGSSYSLEKTWAGDIDIRVRVQGFSGSTAYEFYEAVGVFTSAGMTMRVDQSPDNTYNANAIDGSTITNVAINDGTLLVNVSTGSISWAELYAYGVYWLSTEAGIIDEGSFVEAIDPANYIWTDFKIKNTTSPSVPLVISGGWGRDSATNTTLGLVDTSGGTIFATPDVILPYAAGAEATVAIVQAGLTAQGYNTTRAAKIDTVPADVWSYTRG